jgi:hypothetical protein
MSAWIAALWGALGGFAVECLQFYTAIRRTGRWPWTRKGEPGPLPLVVSVVIRLALGAILAGAADASGQVSGPFGALAIGIAAPLLVEQIAKRVPLELPGTEPGARETDDDDQE